MMIGESGAYGMYPRNVALPEIVNDLNQAGFGNEDICMVVSPGHPVATVVRDARIVNADLKENAVSARMIGWFSEFGAVVIPSVGFFIRSQAFFRALVVEQNFTTLCGESKTLAGLGFSVDQARRLGRQLGDFGVLVYVLCRERARADCAIEVLRHAGAGEAASLEKAAAAVA
jgi:hypothetical protein